AYQLAACSVGLIRRFGPPPAGAEVTVDTHYVNDAVEAELRAAFPNAFNSIPMVVIYIRTHLPGCAPQLPAAQQALQRHAADCPDGCRVLFTVTERSGSWNSRT
ncbi:MAG TPA: hypothetical protein VD866_20175, partial [Urbifossiella sp.]|nr:hypothetical protein [Urbifossiella sp.]